MCLVSSLFTDFFHFLYSANQGIKTDLLIWRREAWYMDTHIIHIEHTVCILPALVGFRERLQSLVFTIMSYVSD